MRYKFEKNSLEKIVNESLSLRQILLKLGMVDAGGNYSTLHKKLKEYDIDVSHLVGQGWNSGVRFIPFGTKYILNDILVENSTYNSTTNLKNRLYKEGLKTRFCEECGQSEEWRGKKFSLILDHINGINNDNRIENLRVLCPNCNATLDTHCGKNIKAYKTIEFIESKIKRKTLKKERKNKINEEKKVICNCGQPKHINSKSCNICRTIEKRKVKIKPSIEQLKIEIKELGYSGTGRKYGVSDNAIRKWIR